MIEPNIYCRVSGMVMEAIVLLNREGRPLPIVIEIGTAEGLGTMRYAGFCRLVVGVDTMQSGRPDVVSYEKEEMTTDESLVNSFFGHVKDLSRGQPNETGGDIVRLVIGSSAWRETFEQVERLLNGSKADILVIDGIHHPVEAVRKDFVMYETLVRPGGYVIFDDLYEEDCLTPYREAVETGRYDEVERWRSSAPATLQECGLLRKKNP